MTSLSKSILCLLFAFSILPAQLIAGGGRLGGGWTFELTGGWGGMDSIEGEVTESVNGSGARAGVNVDLAALGLEEEFSTVTFGAKAYNRWVTFLFDYRSSSLEASGTASQEFRFEVDRISFGGRDFEFQVIPVGVDYDLEANVDWFGLGARLTPFILNQDGAVQITPWLHLGIQAVSADYNIDAGGAVGIQSGGTSREFVRQGQSDGSGEAAIPEYGIGGEVRILFHEPGERGWEIFGELTYKILDFQGALDDLGIDDDKFEEIDFSYTALEAGLYAQVPIGDAVDLIGGLYIEQVEIDTSLDANMSEGEVFDREADISYTVYAAKLGLQF